MVSTVQTPSAYLVGEAVRGNQHAQAELIESLDTMQLILDEITALGCQKQSRFSILFGLSDVCSWALKGRRQKHKKTRINVTTLIYLFILSLQFNFFNLLDNIKIKSFERIESCKRLEKIEK